MWSPLCTVLEICLSLGLELMFVSLRDAYSVSLFFDRKGIPAYQGRVRSMGKAVLWRASNFSLLTDTHHTPLVKPFLVVEQGQSKEHRQSIAFRAWNVTGGADRRAKRRDPPDYLPLCLLGYATTSPVELPDYLPYTVAHFWQPSHSSPRPSASLSLSSSTPRDLTIN